MLESTGHTDDLGRPGANCLDGVAPSRGHGRDDDRGEVVGQLYRAFLMMPKQDGYEESEQKQEDQQPSKAVAKFWPCVECKARGCGLEKIAFDRPNCAASAAADPRIAIKVNASNGRFRDTQANIARIAGSADQSRGV